MRDVSAFGYQTVCGDYDCIADAAIGSSGQVPAAHGNLVAEAKDVGRMGTGREDVPTCLAVDEIVHRSVAGT